MSCNGCTSSKNKSLRARLNKRVMILKPTPDTDSYGQPNNQLIPVFTNSIWAAIEPLRGQEFFAAMRDNAEVTTRIRVRYRPGIDRTMVVSYKDTLFEILYIINPEFANEELQLMCKERQ